MNKKITILAVFAFVILLGGIGSAAAQAPAPLSPATPLGTAFTYQGRLVDGALPASGAYDFEFYLYDWPSGAGLVGGPIPYNDWVLTDGSFTVLLDFGLDAFSGQARFLEVRVRPGSSTGAFTTLTPRQELTASPYALYSQRAPWSTLVGLPAGFADGVDNDTLYTAGTGLGLVGSQFSLAASYRLPQSCANNQIPKWNGSSWICAADIDTTYTNGLGLTLSGTTFSADTSYLQRRVAFSCAEGFAIRYIASDGTVGCEADNDTTYTNGLGLTLSGTTFSADTSYLQRRVAFSCASGFAIRYINPDGTVACQSIGDTSTLWSLSGNSGTNPASQYLGTSDNQALELRVNGERALRLEPASPSLDPDSYAPNLIGGYNMNWVTSGVQGATIFGGGHLGAYHRPNRVTDHYGTVSGGLNNLAGKDNVNVNDANYATVGGGSTNIASGWVATVGGGFGNHAGGEMATIPGGYLNLAMGKDSFAAGFKAIAQQPGSFVWSDDSHDISYDPWSYPENGGIAYSFNVRASGGVYFVTSIDPGSGSPTTGLYVLGNDSGWNTYSDPAGKRDIQQVDSKNILTRLASLPVSSWSYKSQAASIRHIGPMAQDFNAVFGVGAPDKIGEKNYINSIDVDGVALAAIQGLYQVVQEKDARLAELEGLVSAQQQQIDRLQMQNAEFEARLSALESGNAPLVTSSLQSTSGYGLLGLMALGAGYAWYRVKKVGER